MMGLLKRLVAVWRGLHRAPTESPSKPAPKSGEAVAWPVVNDLNNEEPNADQQSQASKIDGSALIRYAETASEKMRSFIDSQTTKVAVYDDLTKGRTKVNPWELPVEYVWLIVAVGSFYHKVDVAFSDGRVLRRVPFDPEKFLIVLPERYSGLAVVAIAPTPLVKAPPVPPTFAPGELERLLSKPPLVHKAQPNDPGAMLSSPPRRF